MEQEATATNPEGVDSDRGSSDTDPEIVDTMDSDSVGSDSSGSDPELSTDSNTGVSTDSNTGLSEDSNSDAQVRDDNPFHMDHLNLGELDLKSQLMLRINNFVMCSFFFTCALLRWEDIDHYVWVPLYTLPGVVCAAVAWEPLVIDYISWVGLFLSQICMGAFGVLALFYPPEPTNRDTFQTARELCGLLYTLFWLMYLCIWKRASILMRFMITMIMFVNTFFFLIFYLVYYLPSLLSSTSIQKMEADWTTNKADTSVHDEI